jgi:serine/threonine protein kinase
MDIKLADFGLARKLDRRTIVREGSEKNYAAAPETFSGSFSAQSDVWSIGVIAYILLSRKAPFGGE